MKLQAAGKAGAGNGAVRQPVGRPKGARHTALLALDAIGPPRGGGGERPRDHGLGGCGGGKASQCLVA
jgi:hypothetical protein